MILKQDTANIFHFSLTLPPGQILALNVKLNTLSHLVYDGELHMLTQEEFTESEMSVLRPLLEMFPYYCPYEVLYASFYHGRTSDDVVEISRKRLSQAMLDGSWDERIRAVRDALSRTRIKLRHFGIAIALIRSTGYVLMPTQAPPIPFIDQRKVESYGNYSYRG